MMWRVQTAMGTKTMVIAFFGSRVIVPIISIPGLVSTRHLMSDLSNTAWNAVPHIMWLQASLGLSVLTACIIPSLKGVIDSYLGSTSAAAIQVPYQLNLTGKATFFRATAVGASKGSQSRDEPVLVAGDGARGGRVGTDSAIIVTKTFKINLVHPRGQGVNMNGREDAASGESVRMLTDRNGDQGGV